MASSSIPYMDDDSYHEIQINYTVPMDTCKKSRFQLSTYQFSVDLSVILVPDFIQFKNPSIHPSICYFYPFMELPAEEMIGALSHANLSSAFTYT